MVYIRGVFIFRIPWYCCRMEKRHIITICGGLGSGKSTAAKRVARALSFEHFSGGDFMRKIASQKGISLAELSSIAEGDPEVDKEIDRSQKEFMDANDNFVIDSRLGWYWAPNSFKVFLSVDPRISAERVFADLQAKKSERNEEVSGVLETIEDLQKKQAERLESERLRYKEYYGIENHFDPKNFDLVIDTAQNDIPTVERLIIEGYKKWLA
jgi:cytidylate kinase